MHKQSKLVWMVLLLSDMSFGSDQLKCRKQRSPHETCQEILKALLEDEDNKICADCRAKGKTFNERFCLIGLAYVQQNFKTTNVEGSFL